MCRVSKTRHIVADPVIPGNVIVQEGKSYQCSFWCGSCCCMLGFMFMIIYGSLLTVNTHTVGYVNNINVNNPFPDLYQAHVQFTYDCVDYVDAVPSDKYQGQVASPTGNLYETNHWLFTYLSQDNSTVNGLYCSIVFPSKFRFDAPTNINASALALILIGSICYVLQCLLYTVAID